MDERISTESVVRCPWCGTETDFLLEPPQDQPDQTFFEECHACGQDYRIVVEWNDDGTPRIRGDRGGETA